MFEQQAKKKKKVKKTERTSEHTVNEQNRIPHEHFHCSNAMIYFVIKTAATTLLTTTTKATMRMIHVGRILGVNKVFFFFGKCTWIVHVSKHTKHKHTFTTMKLPMYLRFYLFLLLQPRRKFYVSKLPSLSHTHCEKFDVRFWINSYMKPALKPLKSE